MSDTRKVISLAAIPSSPYRECFLFALCNDGTMWSREWQYGTEWKEIEAIPVTRARLSDGGQP